MFWTFLKLGSVVFGSGYVLLAFLHDDLVELLHGTRTADLAGRDGRVGHALEHLESVAVRAAVLVDRHGFERLAATIDGIP